MEVNGREKEIKSRGDYSDEMITYSLNDYNDVRYDEMIHVVIALPEDHTFEKIALVNGKFVREYGTYMKDIYITTKATFKDLKVKLVREGNLLPMADAQDTMQEYVKIYSNDKELCTKVFCVNIDLVEDEYEFPTMYIGIIPIVGVTIRIVWHVLKTRPGPYPNTPTKHENIINLYLQSNAK